MVLELQRLAAGALTLALLASASSVARAQDAASTEPPPSIRLLDSGDRAPFRGLLIEESDLLRWRMEIERLRMLTGSLESMLDERVLLERERARVQLEGCEERMAIRETQWREQLEEIAESRLAAQQNRMPRWRRRLRSAGLWLLVGAAAGAVTASVL